MKQKTKSTFTLASTIFVGICLLFFGVYFIFRLAKSGGPPYVLQEIPIQADGSKVLRLYGTTTWDNWCMVSSATINGVNEKETASLPAQALFQGHCPREGKKLVSANRSDENGNSIIEVASDQSERQLDLYRYDTQKKEFIFKESIESP